LLGAGCRVYAVEPNSAMRHAAQNVLARQPGFVSVAGRAEETTLPDASVDLVVAAQAFHWFDPPRARAECARILRPGGAVALLWTERITTGDPFLEAYEALLLDHGTDYAQVDHRQVGEPALAAFFGGPRDTRELENAQDLDEAGLVGRIQSCSYVPAEGEPGHGAMLQAAYGLFHDHQRAGLVTLRYRTTLVMGRLNP
jgi:SAM-dependent methyltransferase